MTSDTTLPSTTLPSTILPGTTLPVTTSSDPDIAEQARPGHGIPSQDPSPAAQTALEPDEALREANSTLAGGGLVAGMAAGSAIGAAVGGPVGVVVGAAVGAVAGAVAGLATGTTVGAAVSTQRPLPADMPPAGNESGRIDNSGDGH